MIHKFPYEPLRPDKVVRRYNREVKKLIIERLFAFVAIAATLAGAWGVIMWSVVRFLQNLGVMPR